MTEHAVASADPAIEQLLAPIFDIKEYAKAEENGAIIASGLPAGPALRVVY